MLTDFIQHFNWVDIVIIIVFLRIGYVSLKTGILIEVFKFLGALSAIYISSHYYTNLSDSLKKFIPGNIMPLEFLDFLSFIFLVVIGYLIFMLCRTIARQFFKLEEISILSKWLGLALGLVRGYLVCGILIFAMVISSVEYFKNSSAHSYFGDNLFKVQPGVYTWLWNNIGSKLMIGERFNPTVLEAEKGLKKE